jgi:hypothetical protein
MRGAGFCARGVPAAKHNATAAPNQTRDDRMDATPAVDAEPLDQTMKDHPGRNFKSGLRLRRNHSGTVAPIRSAPQWRPWIMIGAERSLIKTTLPPPRSRG